MNVIVTTTHCASAKKPESGHISSTQRPGLQIDHKGRLVAVIALSERFNGHFLTG